MAALLARATRADARLRVLRSSAALSRPSPARIGACHPLTWRGTQASVQQPSYSTSRTTTKPTGLGSDPRAPAKPKHTPFLRLVHAYKLYIQELADKGDLDMVLRVVYECYRPLYESHAALHGAACSLWDACDDAVSVVNRNTRFSVETHNDTLTRLVELQAMEVFLAIRRPDLAAAIYYHRKTLAATLGVVHDDASGSTVDLSIHHRHFKPLAKRALNTLAAYDEVQAVGVHFQTEKPPSKPRKGQKVKDTHPHGKEMDEIVSLAAAELIPSREEDTPPKREAMTTADELAVRGDFSDIESLVSSVPSAPDETTWPFEIVDNSDTISGDRHRPNGTPGHELDIEKRVTRMMRSIYKRYKPLYDSHPALQGVECPLLGSSQGDDAAATTKKTTRPLTLTRKYNEQGTRRRELKAMAELFDKRRLDLVVAVYNHRKLIAATVGSVVDEKTGHVVDLSDHDKEFSWHAMRAFKIMGDHASVVSVYFDATKPGKAPSPWMTSVCLHSLLTIRRHDHVRALYADVTSQELPVEHHFYRHMLYFASKELDSALMMSLREAMKNNQIPLRSEDYLNAIRSLQDKVLGFHEEATMEVPDRYFDCVQRIANANYPVSSNVADACRQVLVLFDEMVEVAKIKPHHRVFLLHLVRAATRIGDFHRVPKYAALFDRVFGEPRASEAMLVDVVNALLLQDEPMVAWQLLMDACDADKSTSNKMRAACTSILQYLGAHRDVGLTRQFLDALKAKGLLYDLFKRDEHRALIDAVVLDRVHVDDSTILNMLHDYIPAFRVLDKPASLDAFANACIASGRWSLLHQVLKTTNRKRMPSIADSLAVRISDAAVQDESSRERMELVVALTRMVDLALLSDEHRQVLSANATRAVETLGVSRLLEKRPGVAKTTEESTELDPPQSQVKANAWTETWANLRELFVPAKK